MVFRVKPSLTDRITVIKVHVPAMIRKFMLSDMNAFQQTDAFVQLCPYVEVLENARDVQI